jgi:hypothetical protein
LIVFYTIKQQNVFILISDFSNEIDGVMLADAICTTFSHRNTQIPKIPARIWNKYFYEDHSKIIQWNAFLRRNKIPNNHNLKDVCVKIGEFINPVFNMLTKK